MNKKMLKNLILVIAGIILLAFAEKSFAYVPGYFEPQKSYSSKPAFTEIPVVLDSPYYDIINQERYAEQQKFEYEANKMNTEYYYQKPTYQTTTYQKTTNQYPTYYNNDNSYDKNVNSGYVPNSYHQSNMNPNMMNSNMNGYNGPYSNPELDRNQLTALSLNGSGSFLPSSVWQWIIVIFLILIIVIIARSITRKSEEHRAMPTH